MNETYEFMRELDPPFISLTRYVPTPGTEMFQDVVALGLLDPDATDWTWSLNQSLEKVFLACMDPDVFRAKMLDIGAFVQRHNRAKGLRDNRLK